MSRDFTYKSGSTGKEEEEDPGSGGEGFPSHSAVVVSQCLLLDFDEVASSEDHLVSRGQGELLRG